MNINSSRLLIRNLKPTDWEDLLVYRSLPEVCVFQGYDPYDETKAKRLANEQSKTELFVPGNWKQIGIEVDDKLIGDIGLKPESYDIRIVEFGISISPFYQGKGYAKQALKAVFERLFTQHDVHRIFAITSQENNACIRLLEAIGMAREGAMRQSFWNKGKRHDEYLYAILQSDYLLMNNNG